MDSFSCPKRFAKGDDSWREDGTCSYCGSIQPNLFLQQLEDGVGDHAHRQELQGVRR